MRRCYKFLMRPTAKQVAALEECLECMRQLYNAALEERREAWRKRRVSIRYNAQAHELTEIRQADPEGQGRWSCGAQQQTLRRLDFAFVDFFRRAKAGQNPGYPRFRGFGRFDTVTWPATKSGAKWDSVPHPTVTRVYLLGIGHVKVHQHRAVKGRVKMISVRRERGRWYVVLWTDDSADETLPVTGSAVGIDLGVAHLASTSDGEHIPNPRFLAATADRLAEAQRELARKKRGGNRRKNAAEKVGKLHAKVHRQRLDHAHKTALALVRDHDVIVHEKLKPVNLTRRPRPRPAGDGSYELNGAAAKAGLNKSIFDAGWGIFLRVLAVKAESAGRQVIAVDSYYTSQQCAECGHTAKGNRVTQAEFRCLACGHQANADVNAAINILRAGLALQAKAA